MKKRKSSKVSFVSLMQNPSQKWKSAAFSQYPRKRNSVMGYSMRAEQFRYNEWQERKTGKVIARELYDHAQDAEKNFNLANQTEVAEIIKQLSKQMAEGWRKALPIITK